MLEQERTELESLVPGRDPETGEPFDAITIIRGHLEVMGDDAEDRRETLELVSDELDRMARIVDDLLVMAKAEQAGVLHTEVTEVSDLTADVLGTARSLGDRAWQLDGAAAGLAVLDRHRITQAALNLARNALEHIPAGTPVGLGTAWDGDDLRLWVRDEGPGIAGRDRDRIFERFARGHGGRCSEGAGLGLAIVSSVARAHGGRVELQSVPGEGTRFTIVVPGARAEPEEREPPRAAAPERSADLVEDRT
jgi:signal transduction histidine kinase